MTQSVRLKEDVIIQEDILLNDSDKSFTVPAGEEWEVLAIQVNLITTATVGNRQMGVEVQNVGGNQLSLNLSGAVQVASFTRTYTFTPDVVDLTSFILNNLSTRLSKMRLSAGMIVRVADFSAIDAAADDMEVRLLILRRPV